MQGLNIIPIERIDAPSPAEFEAEYVRPGRPVVCRGLAEQWPARGWTLDRLARDFGAVNVPVAPARGGVVMVDPRRGVVRNPTPLREFIASVRTGDAEGYMTARADELPDEFGRAAPAPPYCNGAPWQVAKFWLSSTGILTAMHYDLADNLHTQVLGSKRFSLVDPGESAFVYPNSLLSSIPNGCRVDLEHPDLDRFPQLRRASVRVAVMEPGDTLYIPRRWWHHARTLHASLSVNHWWARGAWAAMVKAGDLLKRLRGISR